jgi:hypothetical protein
MSAQSFHAQVSNAMPVAVNQENERSPIIAVHVDIGAHSRRFSVAAGILPAVEPGRPARRRKRSPTPTVLENFRTALIFHRSFRAAGRQPSTADETSAATTPSPLFPESRQTAPMLIGIAIA